MSIPSSFEPQSSQPQSSQPQSPEKSTSAPSKTAQKTAQVGKKKNILSAPTTAPEPDNKRRKVESGAAVAVSKEEQRLQDDFENATIDLLVQDAKGLLEGGNMNEFDAFFNAHPGLRAPFLKDVQNMRALLDIYGSATDFPAEWQNALFQLSAEAKRRHKL